MNKLFFPKAGVFALLIFVLPTVQAQDPGVRPHSAGAGLGPQKMAEEFLTKFDKDGDKALNAEELAAGLHALRERMAQRRQHAGQSASGAQKTPANSDENSGAGQGNHQGTSMNHVNALIQKFDKNGDQKLDVTELTAMFTAFREHRAEQRGAAGQHAAGNQKPPAPASN
jgi:hypothetical protein